MKVRTRIQALIALHLGALGCTRTQPVGADPVASSVASAATTTIAPSTQPLTVPSLRRVDPPAPVACKTNNDCKEHYYCDNGECRVQGLGRPLVVEGVQHIAAGARDTNALSRAAFEEHASIAAFARTLCELMALGAPAWLIEETQRALMDEIDHARRTFAMLESTSGERTIPGPMPAAVAPFAGPDALLRDVLWGGCVGETRAAHRASDQAGAAGSDEERALYRDIAEDEARHAALAFKTARWLVDTRPELRAVLDVELATYDRSPCPEVGDLIDVLRG